MPRKKSPVRGEKMYDKMKETTDAKVLNRETRKKETHRMNGRLRVEEVNRSERKRKTS
jgi:hypothetical protein